MASLVALTTVACGGKKPQPKEPAFTETVADAGAEEEPPKPKTLYDRLGGKEGIAKVVDVFVQKVAAADATKKRFSKLKPERVENLKTQLTEQICALTGDPDKPECTYDKSMKEVHKNMKITEAEWNATVKALSDALDEAKVDPEDKSQLIGKLAGMHDDIVAPKKKR